MQPGTKRVRLSLVVIGGFRLLDETASVITSGRRTPGVRDEKHTIDAQGSTGVATDAPAHVTLHDHRMPMAQPLAGGDVPQGVAGEPVRVVRTVQGAGSVNHTLDLSLPVEDHLVWDGWAEATGANVGWPNIIVHSVTPEVGRWTCLLDDYELAAYVERLREVCKQPLVGGYAAAADSLIGFLEQVVRVRRRR